MRINDRELLEMCTSTPVFEGRLNYRPPSGNFGQSGFKERWFRLRRNLLFYFRLGETGKVESEPSGVFVMENSIIQLENSSSIPFAFSIIFKDEPYRKHIFSGRSEENIRSWISFLRQCTYEYLRSQRILLQKELTLKTGKDPLLMYPYNEGAIRDFEMLPSTSNEGSPKLTRTSVPLASSHCRDNSPVGKTFPSHLVPVAPPRSSSPKAPTRATHPLPSVPKAPLPVTSSPKLPVRAAPPVPPSSEVNLIDL